VRGTHIKILPYSGLPQVLPRQVAGRRGSELFYLIYSIQQFYEAF